MRVRYSEPANKDIVRAFSDSIRLFGRQQADRYFDIIQRAIASLAKDPKRPASKPQDEFGPGIRSFHLQFAARRQGGASHVVYYKINSMDDGRVELLILRVLPDRMDPKRRVTAAIKSN
ncbi:MAG: type II toxin-antitoxin system RelE/ParE family toxin [Rhizobiaceae bacterium]